MSAFLEFLFGNSWIMAIIGVLLGFLIYLLPTFINMGK